MKEKMKKTFLIFYFIALTFSSFAMENKSYEIKGQAWNKLNINKQQKAEILAIQENFKTSMNKINLNLLSVDDIIKIYEEVIRSSVSTPGRDTWRKKLVRLSGTVEERMNIINTSIQTLLKNEQSNIR